MPEAPRRRTPRFKLTGLEGAEELWERLREANAEIESLLARNADMADELDAMQRRLRGVAGLTDDELAAELPQRMSRNLAAAQEVAEDIIERARNDAMLIRLDADQAAAQIVDSAKAEVARIVRGTMEESQAHVAAARARGNELLRAAHAERSQILADLDDRASRAEQERHGLYEHRQRLEQAYEQVARALADARAGLTSAAEASPPLAAARPEAPRPARARPARPDAGDAPRAEASNGSGRSRSGARRRDGRASSTGPEGAGLPAIPPVPRRRDRQLTTRPMSSPRWRPGDLFSVGRFVSRAPSHAGRAGAFFRYGALYKADHGRDWPGCGVTHHPSSCYPHFSHSLAG